MTPLSAVVITYNEEKNIERCLQSLQGIVDEIVVVDSFSTDKTEEICRLYNVHFYKHTWAGYSEQKNYANTLAAHNLILSLDADEALSEELKTSIQELKENCKSALYDMNRLTNYCGQWIYRCGWYPDQKIRIFDRTQVRWKNMKVHEEMEFPDEITLVHLKGDLYHYSYYTIGEHILQANRYSTLAAEEYFEKGKKTHILVFTIKSVWRFIRDYFFKAGFLDGFYGFVICLISAMTTFLKYSKLKQLHKQKQQRKL